MIRQGMSGSAFYVILEGTATIRVDGVDRGTIRSGDCFGEISSLLGELPTADIVAQRPLRCLALPGAALEPFPHGRYPVVIVGSGPCSGAG